MDSVFLELVDLLKSKKMTVSSAESCTGGMIAQMITDVSGASEVFGLGVVSYATEQKIKTLGVEENIISNFGVYSTQTAEAMAKAVRKLAQSSISVATTGIAGPGGGTEKLPVGTVFIGVDGDKGCVTERCLFEGSRDEVRALAAKKAAQLCIDYLLRG